MSPETYLYPPITEAIIAIDVVKSPDRSVSDLDQVWDAVKEEYPVLTRLQTVTSRLSFGEEMAQSSAQKPVGIRAANAEDTMRIQFRMEGFSLHRMAPYRSWAGFRPEAKRLWETYKEVMRPEGVSRLAVRYINRIDIPVPAPNLSDYFSTVPLIGAGLPQTPLGLFMQLVIPASSRNGHIILNEAIVEPYREGVCSVVLDIDACQSDDISEDEDGIWKAMDDLRAEKNRVFEASIREKTREMFRCRQH